MPLCLGETRSSFRAQLSASLSRYPHLLPQNPFLSFLGLPLWHVCGIIWLLSIWTRTLATLLTTASPAPSPASRAQWVPNEWIGGFCSPSRLEAAWERPTCLFSSSPAPLRLSDQEGRLCGFRTQVLALSLASCVQVTLCDLVSLHLSVLICKKDKILLRVLLEFSDVIHKNNPSKCLALIRTSITMSRMSKGT